MITKDISRRIEILRFPLIVAVVFWHSYPLPVRTATTTIGLQLETPWLIIPDLISGTIVQVSVPLFFVISGLLYFNGFKISFAVYIAKLKRRFRTLLIPFFFWSLSILLLALVVARIPRVSSYLNFVPSCTNILCYTGLIIGVTQPPLVYQFWFLRDLILLVLVAPIIYISVNYAGRIWLSALLWISFFSIINWNFPKIESVLFFSIGAWLVIKGVDLRGLDTFVKYLIPGYIILVMSDAVTKNWVGNFIVHRSGILVGIPLLFWAAGKLSEQCKSRLFSLASSAFFLYATHAVMVTIIRKLSYMIFQPSSQAALLILYFITPLFVIMICTSLYFLLKKSLPRFTLLVTGGR